MSVKINDYSISSVINNIIELLRKKELFTELIFEKDTIKSIIKPIDNQYLKYKYEYFNSKISKNILIILLNFDFTIGTIEMDLSNFFYTNDIKNNILSDDRIYYNINLSLLKEAELSPDSKILKYVSNRKDNNQEFSYIIKKYNDDVINDDTNVKLTTNFYNEKSKDIKVVDLGIIYVKSRKYITSQYNNSINVPNIYTQFIEYMFYDGQILKFSRKLEKDNIIDMSYLSSKMNEQIFIKNKMENYQKDVIASLNRLGNTSLNNVENKNVRSIVNDVVNDIINSFIAKEKIIIDKKYNIDDNISILKKLDNTFLNWNLNIENVGDLNISFKMDKNILEKYVIIDINNIKNINYFKYYMYIDNNYVRRLKLKSSSLINTSASMVNNTIRNKKIMIPASSPNENDLIVNLDYSVDNTNIIVILLSSINNNIKTDIGKYYVTEQMYIPLQNKNDIINRVTKHILHNVEYDIVEFIPYNNVLAYIIPNYFQNIELSVIPDTAMDIILKYFVFLTNTETKIVLDPLTNIKSENGEVITLRGSIIKLDKDGNVVSLSSPVGGKISMDEDKIITIEFPENKKFGIEGFGNNNTNIMFDIKKINILYVVLLLLLIYLIYRIIKNK